MGCHARRGIGDLEAWPELQGLCTVPSGRSSEGLVRVTARRRLTFVNRSCEPRAKVVTGFNRTGMGMPSFAGVLTEQQIESVILYIKSLK